MSKFRLQPLITFLIVRGTAWLIVHLKHLKTSDSLPIFYVNRAAEASYPLLSVQIAREWTSCMHLPKSMMACSRPKTHMPKGIKILYWYDSHSVAGWSE